MLEEWQRKSMEKGDEDIGHLKTLKGRFGKLNKKALVASVGLMLMSWAALPIIYWLIVRKKKAVEEVKEDANTVEN